jgi:ketosteroid isomerase-like protein
MDHGQLQRSPDLEELQRRFYAAANNGDLAFVERYLSHAPATLVLGTDPDEVWDRAATLRAVAEQSAARVRFEGGAPQGWEAGDIGWVVDLEPRFRLGEVVAPFRLTNIFHREDGEWRIVHWHCSLPVPNEEAMGQELPM